MVNTKFFLASGPFSVNELASSSGCEVSGDAATMVKGVSTLKAAVAGEISFYSNSKYLNDLKKTKASVVIISEKDVGFVPVGVVVLLSKNPYEAYAKIATKFYSSARTKPGIASTATIAKTASIGKDCCICEGVVIGENVKIGDGTYVGPNSHINDYVNVGNNTQIKSNVTLSHCHVGDDCIVHTGARIGQDGFGFAPTAQGIFKVPQLGLVVIGNDVEIGANTTIDRGALEDTEIGDGTKIDNLVQIGHGVKIGKHCFIVAQTGIAGSTKIGNGVTIAGQVGIAGHLSIGDGAMIAGQSGVSRNVEPKTTVGGNPAVPIMQFHRISAYLKKISQKSDHRKGE